jgi:addiction module HigA family antidote
MDIQIEIIKGIHPGKILKKSLQWKGMSQRSLAKQAGTNYQTINAIITEKRNIPVDLSLRLDEILGFKEGFFAMLQMYNQVKKISDAKSKRQYPNPPNIRKSVFWDTDFEKINWGKHKRFVINRILERGTNEEKEEIASFYDLSVRELEGYRYTNYSRLSENNDYKRDEVAL